MILTFNSFSKFRNYFWATPATHSHMKKSRSPAAYRPFPLEQNRNQNVLGSFLCAMLRLGTVDLNYPICFEFTEVGKQEQCLYACQMIDTLMTLKTSAAPVFLLCSSVFWLQVWLLISGRERRRVQSQMNATISIKMCHGFWQIHLSQGYLLILILYNSNARWEVSITLTGTLSKYTCSVKPELKKVPRKKQKYCLQYDANVIQSCTINDRLMTNHYTR